MKSPRPCSAGLALLVLGACTARSPQVSKIASAPLPAGAAVASFDSAWSRIRATYYDSTFHGNDWSAVRDSLRPLAERARSQADLRHAIESLFVRLGESHFAIIPREVASSMEPDSSTVERGAPGELGLAFRLLGDRVVISRVDEGSSAEGAGLHTGLEVLRVGTLDLPALVSASNAAEDPRVRRAARLQVVIRAAAATFGVTGEKATIVVRDRGGIRRSLEIPRGEWRGQIVRYGPLPPQYFAFEHRRYTDDGGCTGVIRFSVWMTPLLPHLERAMEDLQHCRGVILDLRGNTGGIAALVMGASGFFVTEPVSLGSMTTRVGTLRYMANPRRSNRRGEVISPFAGRLAIVVDATSASTTEIFAKGMRDIGRARLFGDTTAGQALPATLSRLPNGDLLLHVIADFHSPKGTRLEAVGVIPETIVPVRHSDLLIGVDAPMVAAFNWVGRTGHRTSSSGTLVPPHP
jgi:carboxyl-terminal processing protease